MLRLYGRYLKKHIPEIIINLLFLGIQVYVQTFIIMRQMKTILDQGVAAADMERIVRSCVLMAGFTLLAILCTVMTSYMSARIVAGFACEVRRDCIRKIYALTPQEFARFGSSSLVTRVMSDLLQVQQLLINLCRSSMMMIFVIIGLLILIFMINPVLAAVLLGAFAATVAFMVHRGVKIRPLFERIQKLTERVNLLFREKLDGARTIRAFRNETLEEEKMAAASTELFDANIQANKPINYMSPVALMIMNWTVVVIYLIGAEQMRRGLVSLSDLMLIINYLSYFIAALVVVPVIVNLIPKVRVSSARIMELLDFALVRETGMAVSGITGGEIEFQDVVFGYSGSAQIIDHVSVRAEAGKTTAVIGATGSGKTTLMNLLQGLYRMTSGDILIDGISIRTLDQSYLQRNISYATQKTQIFQDTVLSNLTAYDDSISDQRLRQALSAACFDEVVENLTDGMGTRMAQNGMNLSGGQRQRLTLARALAKDAAIYVFDDSMSSLDAQTEQRVRAAMRTMLAGRTVLLVSQKISAVRDADKIIVLDNGRVVGAGTHEALLDVCPEYREIYRVQYYNKEKQNGKE